MAARLTAFVVSAIVAVTFVAGLIVGAQREDDGGPADLIIHNARVYLGSSVDAAEALAIRGGKIVRVGSNKEIDRLRRRQTMDAKGGTVTAGLNDSGLQLFDGVVSPATVTPSDSPDGSGAPVAPAPVVAPVAAAGSSTPAIVAASTAFVTPQTTSTHAPTAPLSREEQLDALRRTIKDAHSVGLTSVQTTVSSPEELMLLSELRRGEELNLRVSVALTATLPLDDAGLDRLEGLRKLAVDDAGLVKVGAVRLTLHAADGRNAQRARGNARKSAAADQLAQLADAITTLDQRHWQIILDTPTAADVALAADAFERAFGDRAAAVIRLRRHRLDLSNSIDDTLAARLTALELIPSIPSSLLAAAAAAAEHRAEAQSGDSGIETPKHSTADGEPSPARPDVRVAAVSSSLAALLANPRTVLRSNWPVGQLDPLKAIAAASAAATSEPVELFAAALDAYTSRAAYASHDELLKGAVAKDQAADLIIFSTDLFSAAPTRSLDAIVTTTIIDGKVVFTQPIPKPAPTEQ
jgi:predicted amidohydrolase YtcJ